MLYPPHLSPGAQDFIKGALNRDPARRPSIPQLLEHPWVLQFTKRRRDKDRLVQRSKSDLTDLVSYQQQVWAIARQTRAAWLSVHTRVHVH